jgi:phosphoribosylaminoimidazole-succinocarboxamide synthase
VSTRLDEGRLRAQLGRTLAGTEGLELSALGQRSHGKVRDSFAQGGVRTLVVTDRISAFDVVLGTIPWKGQVLNQLAAHWFRRAAAAGLPTHFLDTPDPNVTRAIECRPLPVEMVMRAYLTGVTSTSIWSHYDKGARVYAGHALPEGLRKNDPLPRPLLTPSTKAEHGGHDETVSREELLRRGGLDAATFDEAAELCARMFALGQAIARERGLILVDTKYELGRTPDGKLVFIDEVHTPDSSRYWLAPPDANGQVTSLDKEYVRTWLAEAGYRGEGTPPGLPDEVRIEAARRYIDAYERVTGEAFAADEQPPAERIERGHRSWPRLQPPKE